MDEADKHRFPGIVRHQTTTCKGQLGIMTILQK